MHRREVLKYTALVTGAVVSAPLVASLLSGCSDMTSSAADKELYLDEESFGFLTDIIDTILPSTDSPSASEVGVHLTIDHMIGKVYNDGDRNTWRTRFDALKRYLNGADSKFSS